MPSFGERLRTLRTEEGYSQRHLAERLGLSYGTIAMYETGRRTPEQKTLTKLADFFNVSVDYLLGRTDDRRTGEIRVGLHRTDGYDKPLPPEAVKSIEEFIDFVHKKYGYGPRPDQPKPKEADRGRDRKPEGPGEE